MDFSDWKPSPTQPVAQSNGFLGDFSSSLLSQNTMVYPMNTPLMPTNTLSSFDFDFTPKSQTKMPENTNVFAGFESLSLPSAQTPVGSTTNVFEGFPVTNSNSVLASPSIPTNNAETRKSTNSLGFLGDLLDKDERGELDRLPNSYDPRSMFFSS